jgi:hypothetical protein
MYGDAYDDDQDDSPFDSVDVDRHNNVDAATALGASYRNAGDSNGRGSRSPQRAGSMRRAQDEQRDAASYRGAATPVDTGRRAYSVNGRSNDDHHHDDVSSESYLVDSPRRAASPTQPPVRLSPASLERHKAALELSMDTEGDDFELGPLPARAALAAQQQRSTSGRRREYQRPRSISPTLEVSESFDLEVMSPAKLRPRSSRVDDEPEPQRHWGRPSPPDDRRTAAHHGHSVDRPHVAAFESHLAQPAFTEDTSAVLGIQAAKRVVRPPAGSVSAVSPATPEDAWEVELSPSHRPAQPRQAPPADPVADRVAARALAAAAAGGRTHKQPASSDGQESLRTQAVPVVPAASFKPLSGVWEDAFIKRQRPKSASPARPSFAPHLAEFNDDGGDLALAAPSVPMPGSHETPSSSPKQPGQLGPVHRAVFIDEEDLLGL